MALDLWNSGELYQLLRDDRLDAEPSFFLDSFFPDTYFSDDEIIRFAKLPQEYRVLAPFVLPTEQGKPIFKRKAEVVNDIRPPYIKPKDAVRAEDAMNVLPSEVYRSGGQRPSLEQRYNRRIVEVTQYHLRAIKMRKIWMAARAVLDAKVQIDYERDQGASAPSVLLDFGRAAGHTVIKTTDFWDDPDTPIMTDIEGYLNTMVMSAFGGAATQMIVGASVAPWLKRNTQIKDMLDTRYRGGESVSVDRGIFRTAGLVQPLTRIGQLSDNLEVFMYRDYVENNNGALIDIMDPRDILLVAPGASGVVAHGAILDDEAIAAGLSSVDVFPKMWREKDPGATFMMHQSAPLPIPLYPNRTFKARVLA